MNLYSGTASFVIGSFVMLGSLGCSSVTRYELSSGFVVKLTTAGPTWESGGGSRTLYYDGSNGKHRRVWEHVGAAYARNGTAVFIGWREDREVSRGNTYFAAKEDGPVFAIAEAVLRTAAQNDQIRPEEYLKKHGEGAYKLNADDDAVRFEFTTYGVSQPHLFVSLTWQEVSHILGTLIQNGKVHKDKSTGLLFVE